jgi:hypothetical protein
MAAIVTEICSKFFDAPKALLKNPSLFTGINTID